MWYSLALFYDSAELWPACAIRANVIALELTHEHAVCIAAAGMWYSLALFYDSAELGPAYATVAMATAVASVLGGPIAACLLTLNGLGGLHGWQASMLTRQAHAGLQHLTDLHNLYT